jgi:hypothetical protein
MPLYMGFLHNFLNVLVQNANKVGLPKEIPHCDRNLFTKPLPGNLAVN